MDGFSWLLHSWITYPAPVKSRSQSQNPRPALTVQASDPTHTGVRHPTAHCYSPFHPNCNPVEFNEPYVDRKPESCTGSGTRGYLNQCRHSKRMEFKKNSKNTMLQRLCILQRTCSSLLCLAVSVRALHAMRRLNCNRLKTNLIGQYTLKIKNK